MSSIKYVDKYGNPWNDLFRGSTVRLDSFQRHIFIECWWDFDMWQYYTGYKL